MVENMSERIISGLFDYAEVAIGQYAICQADAFSCSETKT
jgi:hypothetical protein